MPTNPTIQQDTSGRNVAGVQIAGQNQQVAIKGGTSYTDVNTGVVSAPAVMQLQDANTTNQATITALHNADQQAFGATTYGMLTGGVAQMVNALGSLDRQRETGQDGIAAVGIATGSAQFAMAFATTDSTDNFTAGLHTFTPVAMSGTIQGVAWSIQPGSVLTIDTGGSAEVVTVLNPLPSASTFSCTTTKSHNGTVTPFPITGFVYNQERDAAGELDGASGAGTAIAAEYEYNGGANAGALNYDRERNVQGKGVGTQTISAGGGAASTSLTLSGAPTGLQPGQPIYLTGGTAETNYVAKNYTVGSTTVPLAFATANGSHTGITFDIYAQNGAGASGMTQYGLGIETMASYDKGATAGQNYYLAQGFIGAIAVQQGGLATALQAANTAGNVVVKNSRGILCSVHVTTTGTAGLNIYDNASTNSGTVVCAIPANATVGTTYTVNMPCANGITSNGVSNCPGVTISYV